MEITILAVVGVLAALTVIYRLLPHRDAGTGKPTLALLPKYRKRVRHRLNQPQLEAKLAEFGFRKTGETGSLMKFSRGSVLGDISIELAKVNVGLQKITDGEHEITVNAGWLVAFDTGDHWQFITELSEKIRNA